MTIDVAKDDLIPLVRTIRDHRNHLVHLANLHGTRAMVQEDVMLLDKLLVKLHRADLAARGLSGGARDNAEKMFRELLTPLDK